jgi:hypothetical protein
VRTANGTASATRCSCIAILWVSLVSFATITLCVASQQVFVVVVVVVVVVYFVIDSVQKLLDTPLYCWSQYGALCWCCALLLQISPIRKLVQAEWTLDPTQQPSLASRQPWTMSSGRYRYDRLDLQPYQYPEDVDRSDLQNVGFFTFQLLDPAVAWENFIKLNCWESIRSYIDNNHCWTYI